MLHPSLTRVVVGQARDLGHGVHVARVLPQAVQRAVGPFVFLDHMGPIEVPPGVGFDVRPHPHIGLATVTFLYEGEVVHRDSLGVTQVIRADALNVMVAGRGVVHSERATPETRARGGRMHGLQLWMALPLAEESCAPRFEHRDPHELPTWAADGARVRVVLGAASGRRAPTEVPGAPLLVDVVLDDGCCFEVTPDGPDDVNERAVYVSVGAIAHEGVTYGVGSLLVAAPGAMLALTAVGAARVAVVGGAPLDAPRHLEWNFVASTRERLAQARDDWRARRFPTIPGDDVEFIPLP
jgi:redox-sensitive bicupin YhaK (pirin superfamily)